MKYTAAPSGDQTGCWGQASRSGVASRPSPLARSMIHSVSSPIRSGTSFSWRTQTTVRPSGDTRGSPYQASSAVRSRCSPVARSMATSLKSVKPSSSEVTMPVMTVEPSGVMSKPCSTSALPAAGVRSTGSAIRSSPCGSGAANRWRSRGPWNASQCRIGNVSNSSASTPAFFRALCRS